MTKRLNLTLETMREVFIEQVGMPAYMMMTPGKEPSRQIFIPKIPIRKLLPAVAVGAYRSGYHAEYSTDISLLRGEERRFRSSPIPIKTREDFEPKPVGKGAEVIRLMSRDSGATRQEISDATGWRLSTSAASYIPQRWRRFYAITKGDRNGDTIYFATLKTHRA